MQHAAHTAAPSIDVGFARTRCASRWRLRADSPTCSNTAVDHVFRAGLCRAALAASTTSSSSTTTAGAAGAPGTADISPQARLCCATFAHHHRPRAAAARNVVPAWLVAHARDPFSLYVCFFPRTSLSHGDEEPVICALQPAAMESRCRWERAACPTRPDVCPVTSSGSYGHGRYTGLILCSFKHDHFFSFMSANCLATCGSVLGDMFCM